MVPSTPSAPPAVPPPSAEPPAAPPDRAADLGAAVAGAVAGAAGIAVGELIAGVITGAPSLVLSLGDLVIRYQPSGAKDLFVNLFGTNDKLVLNVVILIVAVAIAAAIGVVGRYRWNVAVGAFTVLAIVIALASLQEPLVAPLFALVTPFVALAVSVRVLQELLRMLFPSTSPAPSAARSGRAASPGSNRKARAARVAPAQMPDWNRRKFLITSGSIAVGSVAVGVVGRALLNRQPNVPTAATPIALPSPSGTIAALPVVASLDVPGITPIVMPNDQFYRIDTALVIPRVDVNTWKLTVKGMVTKEVSFTYQSLQALGLFEQYVTIACVSNHVGENLVGNAKWTGVHLRDVLAEAGVLPGATQIVGRSVDGFTVGFPTEWAMDPQRDPMVVIGMNGAVLPSEHGYPARLIVPGLFGYVSATKWLSEIELTTLEAFDAYWVPLGWSKEGPILTQSRIDVPQNGGSVRAGTVAIAGVAWAPDRGVSKVEVKIDDGPWNTCTLSAAISKATWLQWRYDWAATHGTHRIEVRATDGTGEVQTAMMTDPAPDGARGHHTISVNVS